MTRIAICCSLVVAMLSGCKQFGVRESVQRQASAANDLTLVFDGEQMGGKIFPISIYIESETKVKTQFHPVDAVSVEQSAFAFKPVWSPTGKWLLLPNGRFEGFAAFEADRLPQALENKSDLIRIGVCGLNGTRFWHEFVGWKSASVFRFKAGLSGNYFEFECDLKNGTIISVEAPGVEFRKL